MSQLPPEADPDSKTKRLLTDMKPGEDYTPNDEQLKEMINKQLDGSGWRLEAQGAKPEQAGVTQVLHFHKRGEPSQNFELTTDTVQNYELAQLFVANLLGE